MGVRWWLMVMVDITKSFGGVGDYYDEWYGGGSDEVLEDKMMMMTMMMKMVRAVVGLTAMAGR